MTLRTAALLVLVLALVGTTAVAAPTVSGDAQAWREVAAALRRLRALRTYRVALTTATGRVPVEVVNPGTYRTIVDLGDLKLEGITAPDGMTRQRAIVQGTPQPWQCQKTEASELVALGPDPDRLGGRVRVARVEARTIEGVATRGYRLDWQDRNVTARLRVFVRTDRNLPMYTELLNERERVTAAGRFFDYDAPIRIVVPRCT